MWVLQARHRLCTPLKLKQRISTNVPVTTQIQSDPLGFERVKFITKFSINDPHTLKARIPVTLRR